jgi:hypothetical protein
MTNSTTTKPDTRKLAIAMRRIRKLDELTDQAFDHTVGGPCLFPQDRAPVVSGLHEAIKGAAEDLYAAFHPTPDPATDTSTEIEKDIAAEVREKLLEKLSQIRNAPGAIICFEVKDREFRVRVDIQHDENEAVFYRSLGVAREVV